MECETRLSLTVSPAQSGKTVLTLLRRELGLSSTAVRRAKRLDHGILLNGSPVFTNVKAFTGSVLSVRVDDGGDCTAVSPSALPLHIYFEDEHLLVLDKPAGIPVYASGEEGCDSVAARFAAHCGGVFHPVSRLDRGVSGLMAVAKNPFIHAALQKAAHTDGYYRAYFALTTGIPPATSGKIDAPIALAPGSVLRRMVAPGGQQSVTRYSLLERKNGISLLECLPETGRTHQIRVHMAALGCPLLGDFLYGNGDEPPFRPALHSACLSFIHPVSGFSYSFHSPLPEDMAAIWFLREPAVTR